MINEHEKLALDLNDSRLIRLAQAQRHKIVVVEDEASLCELIQDYLSGIPGLDVVAFTDAVKARKHIASTRVDIVISDLVIGQRSGMEILEATLGHHPDAIVILMTAYPTVKTAISVLQKGGYDYLVKPFQLERLHAIVMRGLETLLMRRENIRLREELGLLRVSSALVSDVEVEDTLRIVAESAYQDLGANAVALSFQSGDPRIDAISIRLVGAVDTLTNAFLATTLEDHIAEGSPERILRNEENGDKSYTLISLPIKHGDKIYGCLNACFDRHCKEAELRVLELLSSSASTAVSRSLLDARLAESYLSALQALANAIEARDRYTAGHTDRVCFMTELLARERGWSERKILQLRQGCTLHDIGKIGVPDSILNKDGPLDEYERNIMQKHPELGVQIISGLDFLKPAVPYVLFHHERYDGKGYPTHLAGSDIPIEGRLLAVADTFDAIVSDRPYRRGRTFDTAIQELKDHKGTQFDPDVVDDFLSVYSKRGEDIRHLYSQSHKRKSLRALLQEF